MTVLEVTLLLLLLIGYTTPQDITTRQGSIQGKTVEADNRQVFAYLGIPYAMPPIGTRRFKPPELHSGWSQVLKAIEFGPSCPQPFQPGLPISEDCLTLNIWTPATGRYRQYPVVVVLEGELFLTSIPSRFPGQDLAIYDLIVVTINYRVNAFGFLSWQDQILPGNLGLRDQALALRWISNNIELFGGDVRSITLLGHSAGGASVAFHLVSELTRDLFQRAIILSGSSLSPWAVNRNPRSATTTLATELGCRFNTTSLMASYDILTCLQSRNLALTEIINKVEKMIELGNPHYMFAPVYDAHVNRESRFVGASGPLRMLESVPTTTRDVLVGITELDGSVMLFAKREINYMSYSYLRRYGREVLVPLVNGMSDNTGPGQPLLNYLVDFTYLQKASEEDKADLVKKTIQMFTDSFFAAPIVAMTEILARRGFYVHLFVNDFPSPDIYMAPMNLTGALHGAELALLFGPTAYTRIFRRPLNYDEAKMSETLKKMVYSFAVRGEPTLGTSYPIPLRWERYTLREPVYALLSLGQLRRNYRYHDLGFWNFLLPDLARMTESIGSNRPPYHTTSFIPPDITFYPTLGPTELPSKDEEFVSYQSAVWVLVTVLLLLVLSVTTFIICARRRQRLNSATLHVPP